MSLKEKEDMKAPESIFVKPGKAIAICQNFPISTSARVKKMDTESLQSYFGWSIFKAM